MSSLLEQCFYMMCTIASDYHDSLLESICKLEPFFDMPSLRKKIIQTFLQCHSTHEIREIMCLFIDLINESIGKEESFSYWKCHIVKQSMTYKHGHKECSVFSMQMLCELLEINIYICTTKQQTIILRFYSLKGKDDSQIHIKNTFQCKNSLDIPIIRPNVSSLVNNFVKLIWKPHTWEMNRVVRNIKNGQYLHGDF